MPKLTHTERKALRRLGEGQRALKPQEAHALERRGLATITNEGPKEVACAITSAGRQALKDM